MHVEQQMACILKASLRRLAQYIQPSLSRELLKCAAWKEAEFVRVGVGFLTHAVEPRLYVGVALQNNELLRIPYSWVYPQLSAPLRRTGIQS